ncbi:MAG: TonB-dependent receptor [Acidobacteria bacterium]|nr:TonB-dependent receptor [Acidobacteriota bacterium]
MWQRIGMLFVSGVFLVVASSHAQMTTATISGRVADATGALIPGAQVVVRNELTGISRTVQTDAGGRYSVPALNPGGYRVTATIDGFQSEIRSGIVLTVGREAIVNFELQVGAITQTVEVTGEAPLVQTTQSSVDFLVEDTTVRELPLNGRDMAQLVLLNPGVSTTELARNDASYYGFGKLISVAGFKEERNAFLLDGTDINDFNGRIPAGPSGSFFGAETVREFEVKTSSYSAQYGRALGAVMNAVSRSGTNSFNGNVFEFLRNSALDARDFFDVGEVPPFKRNQFGATLGGPLMRDQTFFFAGYEGMRQRRSVTDIVNVPDENMRRGILPGSGQITLHPLAISYLALYPTPTPGARNFGDGRAQFIFAGPQKAREDFGQVRIDHQLSDNDSIFGRFTIQDSDFTRTSEFPPFANIRLMKTKLFTLSHTRILSPTALNNFRFAFNRIGAGDQGSYPTPWPEELLSIPGQPNLPVISVSGLVALGGDDQPIISFVTNKFEYIDDAILQWRDHSLKFGVNWQHVQFNQVFPNRPMGTWSFSSVRDFLGGKPSRFRGTPDGITPLIDFANGWRQDFIGLYFQDDWQVRPGLTLNLGLRYDFFTVPTEVNGKVANLRNLSDSAPTVGEPFWENGSLRDFGPRFGFAWTPFASGKTSLRGGFGIFYARLDSAFYRAPASRNGVNSPDLSIRSPQLPNFFPKVLPLLKQVVSGGIGGGSPNPIVFEDLPTPSGYQWNVTVQHQLGSDEVFAASYVGSRGLNDTTTGDFNKPLAEFVDGALRIPVGATLQNTNFDQIQYQSTNANSWYNGLLLNFQKRMGNGLQAQVAYTWSQALNQGETTGKASNVPGATAVLFYAHDLSANKGRSGFDIRQNFTSNYRYELPLGVGRPWLRDNGVWTRILGNWDFNGIITLKTGQPFGLIADIPRTLSALIQQKRPNAVAGVEPVIYGDPAESSDPTGADRYFDPTKGFVFPADSRSLGNAGKRTIEGPGIANWDIGLSKNIAITEKTQLQFRTEIYNIFNHANFDLPESSLFDDSGKLKGNAGVITRTATKPREIQFGLKLSF